MQLLAVQGGLIGANELGRALAPIPFGSSAYLAAEALVVAGSEAQKADHLPAMAAGTRIGTFAHSERSGDPGWAGLATTITRAKLTGTKIAVPDGDVAHIAVVTARSTKRPVLALVDLTGPGVQRRTAHSLDPSRSLATLTFDGARAHVLGRVGDGSALLQTLLDRAAVLYAFEQLGGAQRAFDLTREFCLGRYAFGRSIASFQALNHRLADLYVEIELARSNCYYVVELGKVFSKDQVMDAFLVLDFTLRHNHDAGFILQKRFPAFLPYRLECVTGAENLDALCQACRQQVPGLHKTGNSDGKRGVDMKVCIREHNYPI